MIQALARVPHLHPHAQVSPPNTKACHSSYRFVQLRLPGAGRSFSLHEVQVFGWENDPDCTDVCYYAHDGMCDDGGPQSSFQLCDLGSDCSDCGTIDDRNRNPHLDQDLPFPPPPPASPGYVCSCDGTCYWNYCDASCDDYNDACNRGCQRRRRGDYLGCDHGCSKICTSSCDATIHECDRDECHRAYGGSCGID